MHIDSYQFGRIVIDGVDYTKDIIIIGESIFPNWWRKQGHTLSAEDLDPVIDAKPAILIVGCGTPGLMKVPPQTKQVLQENNIQVEALNTTQAVKRFNELSKTNPNLAIALHLTC